MESFLVDFLDRDISEVVATRMASCSLFERGEDRWVEGAGAKLVEVPRRFRVALDFRASWSKGGDVRFDASTGGKHQRGGPPRIRPEEVDFSDWMIEVVVENSGEAISAWATAVDDPA